jgi:hypothetical protein
MIKEPRLLEMDPVFLAQTIRMHQVTHIATQELLTVWSQEMLENLPERPEIVPGHRVTDFHNCSPFTEILDPIMETWDESKGNPVILIRTVTWAKGRLLKFIDLLNRLWLVAAMGFRIVAISMIPDVPGTWELWRHLAPCEYPGTAVRDRIHSMHCVDFKVLHRLHGALHNRTWDFRPAKCWITLLQPNVAVEFPEPTIYPWDNEFMPMDPLPDAGDTLMIDYPEDGPEQTALFHSETKEILLNLTIGHTGDGPNEFTSTRRQSPGNSRNQKRTLHLYRLLDKVSPDKILERFHKTSLFWILFSELEKGFMLIFRCSSSLLFPDIALNLGHPQGCLINPNTIAFLKGSGTLTHDHDEITEWANTYDSEIGRLLAITDPKLQKPIWVSPARSSGGPGGGNKLVDTLRLTGAPGLWNGADLSSFFNHLGKLKHFQGNYTCWRPEREDGSRLESIKLVVSHPKSCADLLALKNIRVMDSQQTNIEIAFLEVTEGFPWGIPDDASWVVIGEGNHSPPTGRTTEAKRGASDTK